MGGVSARFAMLGDVEIAEPKALIGFAGPRVIEQTVREKLPEGFQRSEFLLEHGAIDMIVDRREMRDRMAHLLALMMKQPQPADDAEASRMSRASISAPTASAAGWARARSRPTSCCAWATPTAMRCGSAPGPARMAQAGGDHRQGHAHLQLHVRGRAGSRAGRRRRRRAADGADADAGRRAPDALAARRRRHRDFRLAQPAPRQRHQVLLGRRREARRRDRTGDRSRARPAVQHRALRTARQGRAHARCGRPLRRGLQELACPRASTWAACASRWTAPTARPTSSAPLVLRELGARVDAIGVEPERPQHQRRRRLDPSRSARRARARNRRRPRHRLRRRRRPRAVRRRRRRGLRRRRPALRARHRLAATAAACAARWSAR